MTKARDIASAIPAPSTISSAELGFLDGVTSAVQTQIDSKIGSASAINPTIVDIKGDIIAATADNTVARLAVGANNTVLTADSAQATGLKWAAATAGRAYSLLNSGGTALTAAGTITISGISSKENILIIYENASSANASAILTMRINADTGANYAYGGVSTSNPPTYSNTSNGSGDTVTTSIPLGRMGTDVADRFFGAVQIFGAASTAMKGFSVTSGGNSGNSPGQQTGSIVQGIYSGTSAVSSISVILSTGNFDAGFIYVYTSAN